MKSLAAALLCLATALTLRAEAEAEAILKAARMNPLGEPIELKAQLRSGSTSVPFRIVVRDGKVSYVFENPDQEILLGLGENEATLQERRGGKTSPVGPARWDDSVRGGLLSYEDLALQFLYWPNPKLLGEEDLERIPSYKIEVQAPSSSSQYGVVRVWIGKENGALVGIEGFDRDGKLIKRFKVVTVQKLGGQWMLKQMRIERLDPATRKVTGRMYLEITGKTEGAPAV